MKNQDIEAVVEKFNSFIEKWTGDSFAHLIDTDENDGERFRQELRTTLTQKKAEWEEANLDKAWLYIVEATRAESWSKEELREALKNTNLN